MNKLNELDPLYDAIADCEGEVCKAAQAYVALIRPRESLDEARFLSYLEHRDVLFKWVDRLNELEAELARKESATGD